jgi:hypothetical protein
MSSISHKTTRQSQPISYIWTQSSTPHTNTCKAFHDQCISHLITLQSKDEHRDAHHSDDLIKCKTLIETNLKHNAFINVLKSTYWIQKINTKSVYGSLCTFATSKDTTPFAVFKSVRYNDDTSPEQLHMLQLDILHEWVISKALQSISNMSHHSAIIQMFSVPRNTSNGLFMTYAHLQPYINGQTILERFPTKHHITSNRSSFLQACIDVAKALLQSQEECKFVHYDLHCDNVLFCRDTQHVKFIDYGSAVCIHPDVGFIGNKWKHRRTTNKLLCLGSDVTQFFLPLYDFYRFVTHFYVKHPTCTKQDVQPLLSYIHKLHTKYVNITFDATLSAWLSMMFDDTMSDKTCKSFFMEHKCHIPELANATNNGFLCNGVMSMWIKDMQNQLADYN